MDRFGVADDMDLGCHGNIFETMSFDVDDGRQKKQDVVERIRD